MELKRSNNNIDLDIYSKSLYKIDVTKKDGLLLSWGGETGACNIAWIRVVTINWRWPFFHIIEFFTEKTSKAWWLIKSWGVQMD